MPFFRKNYFLLKSLVSADIFKGSDRVRLQNQTEHALKTPAPHQFGGFCFPDVDSRNRCNVDYAQVLNTPSTSGIPHPTVLRFFYVHRLWSGSV